MEYSNAFVCLMGMGIVFFGLTCIILLTYVMSFFCRAGHKAEVPAAAMAAASVPAAAAAEPNRPEMIAAVSAALAEELGTDITGIRILLLKKL